MENLSIQDQQSQGGQPQGQGQAALGQAAGGGGGSGSPQQPTQLPPQMFTTAAQLLDLTDKKLMVALRDGRKLIGVLRSWDQFANLVLQNTVERIFAPPAASPEPSTLGNGQTAAPSGGLYADIKRGVFLVRGENVLLLGEIDLDRDDEPPAGYEPADAELVHKLAEERKEKERTKDKARLKKLAKIGFEGESMGEVLL